VLKADRPLKGMQCGVWGLPGQSRMEGRVIGEWAAETKEEICVRKGRFPTIWGVVENYLDFVASVGGG
jgi:hypothetical protein